MLRGETRGCGEGLTNLTFRSFGANGGYSMESNIFWDMRRTMSYNRFLNFIVGNRGGGKTYGFKKMAIERFMNGKGQFA